MKLRPGKSLDNGSDHHALHRIHWITVYYVIVLVLLSLHFFFFSFAYTTSPAAVTTSHIESCV